VSRKGWLLFAALCVIWGIPYLLIRVAVREISPPTLVFMRTGAAAVLLLPLAVRRRQLAVLLPHWRWIVAYTLAELAIPWLLLARAEQHLSSSLSGLFIAAVPLIGAVLYRVSSASEHLDRRRLAGLIVGFAGVAALIGIDLHSTNLEALIELAITAVGYATGPFIISRRLADLPGLGVVSASVTLTAIGYAPVALTHLPTKLTGGTVAAVAGLAVLCTALAFLLFFELIVEVGPARSTVITYINPVIAVLLGVTLLGESFSTGMALGLPLILAGSVLATRPATARRAVPAA
jgi:drug/metabolite transporter (DMT)-like permease